MYALFPPEYTRYLEVFGGSASVLLGKPPDKFEAFNDFNSDLINLFRCIQKRPMGLIYELKTAPPSSREDFRELFEFFGMDKAVTAEFVDEEVRLAKEWMPRRTANLWRHVMLRRSRDHDVQRAAMYFRLIRTSYSSMGRSYSSQPFTAAKTFRLIKAVHRRFENVVIENQHFADFITHYDRPESFFYCDPPYLDTETMYTAPFGWEDHLKLRELAGNCKGKILISYNDCPEIRKLYEGFTFFDFRRAHYMALKHDPKKEFPELLIANYDILQRQREKPMQRSLFMDTEALSEDELDAILKECVLLNGKKSNGKK